MGLKIPINQKSGVTTGYHNIDVDFVATGLTKQQIRLRSWINQNSRQNGDDPVKDEIILPIRKANQLVPSPVGGGGTIEVSKDEEFNILDQPVPNGSTTMRDAARKIAYQFIKQNDPRFQNAEDV